MTRAPVSSAALAAADDAAIGAPAASVATRRHVLAYGAVLLALLVPLLLSDHPRMVDLPNHLARHFIGGAIAGSEALQSYYDFSWRLIPNLAGDALHVPLSWFLTTYDAGRVTLGLSIALWLAAPVALHRVLWGRTSLWPLFAALVIYNANVAWGFENYVLASALSVLLFALWIAWRDRPQTYRLLIFAVLASGVYLAHVVAFGLLGLLVLTFEAGDLCRRRQQHQESHLGRLATALLPFGPGALHFLSVLATSQSAHGSGMVFGTLGERVAVLLSPTVQFLGTGDLLLFAVLMAVFLFGVCRRRWFRLHPAMAPVLLVLAVAAAVAPVKLMGVWLIHFRLPFVLVVLLVAASRWEGPSLALRQGFAVLFAAVLAARLFDITLSWRQHDAEVAELIAAFRKLDDAPRLLSVAGSGADPGRLHWHSAAFAVIERNAYSPSLFTGAHLLRTAPAFSGLDHPQAPPAPLDRLAAARAGAFEESDERFWKTWWRDYSHLLVLDRRPGANPFPDLLEPVAAGTVFVLYRNRGFDAAGSASGHP